MNNIILITIFIIMILIILYYIWRSYIKYTRNLNVVPAIGDNIKNFYSLCFTKNTTIFKLIDLTLKENNEDIIILNSEGIVIAKIFSGKFMSPWSIHTITKLFIMAPKMYTLLKKIYFLEKYDNDDLVDILNLNLNG